MPSYSIRKISDNDKKEINKTLTLNVQKFTVDSTMLYFDIDGSDIPLVIGYNDFFNNINENIKGGYVRSITYDNGIVNIVTFEGNIKRNYTYDFNYKGFDLSIHDSHFDYLKRSIFKTISMYNESPSTILSIQKYISIICNIIDGDNIPIIDDRNEIINILNFYNDNKELFLNLLIGKIVFFDDNGNIIEYNETTRNEIIDNLITDIFSQMEASIIIFIQENNACELYQSYLDNLFIPRRELSYQIDNIEEQPPEEEMIKKLSRD